MQAEHEQAPAIGPHVSWYRAPLGNPFFTPKIPVVCTGFAVRADGLLPILLRILRDLMVVYEIGGSPARGLQSAPTHPISLPLLLAPKSQDPISAVRFPR